MISLLNILIFRCLSKVFNDLICCFSMFYIIFYLVVSAGFRTPHLPLTDSFLVARATAFCAVGCVFRMANRVLARGAAVRAAQRCWGDRFFADTGGWLGMRERGVLAI